MVSRLRPRRPARQSTGAFPTLGIVRSEPCPSTTCWSKTESTPTVGRARALAGASGGPAGPAAYARQQTWIAEPREELGRAGRPTVAAAPRGVEFAVEQYDWGSAVAQHIRPRRDPADRRQQPSLPILVNASAHRASTRGRSRDLRRDLHRLGPRPAPCLVDLDDDAWHGFLVYAEYGAANLRAAKALRP